MKSVFAVVAVCSAAWAQESGRDVLERVAAAYRDVRGFQMTVTVASNRMARRFPVVYAAPDRWGFEARTGFPDYRRVLEGLESARAVRKRDGLEVEGKYAGGLRRSFRIDPARFVVLHEENEVQGAKQTVTVADVVWDRVPPEVAFTPPPARGMKAGWVPPGPLHPGAPGNCTRPEISPEAAIAHLEGMVGLRVTVGADGVPGEIEVTKPVGLGMDEEAKLCASMARYRPAAQDGVPVESHIEIGMTVGGGRPGDSDWHLTRAEFFPAEGAARPVFVKAGYPMREDTKEAAVVEVRAVIGADGVPREVVGSGSGNAKIAGRAARIVEKWRFRGTGADVPARFELRVGRMVLRWP